MMNSSCNVLHKSCYKFFTLCTFQQSVEGLACIASSTLLSTDYLLASYLEHVYQKDIANVVLLGHQVIYCSGKVIRPKACKY